jgi:hypothetical protein
MNRRAAAVFRIFVVAVALIAVAAGATLPADAAPKSELWPRWQAHDPASTLTVDHSAWSRLLQVYTGLDDAGIVRFDYGGVTGADRAGLDGYIASLSAAPVDSLARPEQLAYWVNLYNALTVRVILGYYPVDSILDIGISPGLFSIGPWGKKLVTVAGENLSLDDIEHRILRPIWRDPRIHYAVNCASIGCPNLKQTAYAAANLDATLDANARAYINYPRGVDMRFGALTVSNIYDWFVQDFGDNEIGVPAHLRAYVSSRTSTVTTTIGP